MHKDSIKRARNTATQEYLEAYQRDGVICIRQLLTLEEIEILRQGIDENLQSPSPRAKIASKNDDPGLFIEDFCNWNVNTHYKQFIFDSPIAAVAGLLMESRSSRLYHDHMLVKEKGTKQWTPWHQDQPYYNIEGTQNCSLWIPVDYVDRKSTLEFVAGSHKGPWLMPRSFMDNQAKWFPEGSLAELPNIEERREDYPIIGWEINPGDVVCFHMLTLHAAGPVVNRRRVFSVRFLGDDVTYVQRPWETSPEFPGLSSELLAGGSMDHPLFPLLWQAEYNEMK